MAVYISLSAFMSRIICRYLFPLCLSFWNFLHHFQIFGLFTKNSSTAYAKRKWTTPITKNLKRVEFMDSGDIKWGRTTSPDHDRRTKTHRSLTSGYSESIFGSGGICKGGSFSVILTVLYSYLNSNRTSIQSAFPRTIPRDNPNNIKSAKIKSQLVQTGFR